MGNGIREIIRTGYEISYDADIFKIIYCKIQCDKHKYNNDFVNFVDQFDTHKDNVRVKIKVINNIKLFD